MTIKSNLLTSVAALTLLSGTAFAQENTETTLETDAEITTETNTDMAASANPYAPGWDEDLDSRFGDIADRQIAELIGMNVVTDGGDDVGEVDNFVIMQDELKAVIGVGGFLGLGEHEVALSLGDLTYDGDKLVIPYTAEELEAMPQYTEELEQIALNEQDTFRTRSDMEASADQNSEMAGTQLESDENTEEMAEVDANIEGEGEAEVMAEGEAEVQTDEDSAAMDVADGTAESDADEMAAPTGEEVAAAEEAAGDEDTMTEEVAEAEKGEIEQESEELAAEADAAVTEGAEAVTGAAEATEDAVEGAAEETEQVAENAAAETEAAVEEGAEEVAEAGEDAGEAIEEGAEDVAAATENTAEGAADWISKLDNEFAEIAEWPVADLEGKAVATANGDVIGEVDDLGMQNAKLVAVVGIGGFLGLGEHDVALDLDSMSWDGEKFIAQGYSEEQLKGMAEYDPETLEPLEADVTLRAQADM